MTTECKYYRDKDKECDVWGIPCEMKDCYFKELKRLEQENEKLKEEVEIKDNISEDFRKKHLNGLKSQIIILKKIQDCIKFYKR